MKIKRQLQKANEEINKKILEDGSDLYNTLIEENYFVDNKIIQTNNKKQSKKLAWIFSLSSVFISVIAISLILGFTLTNRNVQYTESNMITIDCSLDEVNNADNKISVNTEQFTYSCHKTYDESSGDTLYYYVKLTHNSDLLEGQISIVTNQKYSFKEYYNNEKTVDTYNGYTMTYSVELDESDMLPMNKFFGCLEVDDTKVYFEFSGVAFVHTTPNLFLDEALIIK